MRFIGNDVPVSAQDDTYDGIQADRNDHYPSDDDRRQFSSERREKIMVRDLNRWSWEKGMKNATNNDLRKRVFHVAIKAI
jgi:hypothetical protein